MSFEYDYNRINRIGMPEAVLCEGKDLFSLNELLKDINQKNSFPVLLTRLSPCVYEKLSDDTCKRVDYDPLSKTGIMNGKLTSRVGLVGIVTAGTSDLPIAMEVSRTLEFYGLKPQVFFDIGVAGLWRFVEKIEEINKSDVVIVVAGMDAALATVVAGEIGKPVIGVPTSVGYGTAENGKTAMNAMLTSCAQGLLVTNIDNGFGAACAAIRILEQSNTLP